ncbi:MAG: carbon-nitrogen hydrolase family protein [Solirubrobacteraceae bacterium]
MSDPAVDRQRVVAVQLAVRLGEIDANLRHIEDIVTQAVREHSPDMVFLPEVSTTPNISHPAMRTCALPVDGSALALYRRLAREHGCVIGAGALTIRGRDTFNTYYVVEPDGTAHLHDKDQPSMWENQYYRGGTDPGIADTAVAAIGVANGFEWIRTRTAARLRERVRLLAGGMCFPSFPQWALTRGWFWRRDHGTMLQLARETPGRMARLLGVPAVHPSHVGDITMRTPMVNAIPWPTIMVGETQITDADGVILGRLAYEDGEGWIAADLDLAPPVPRDPLPGSFWTTSLPASVHAVWHLTNTHGRAAYALRRARGVHPWQQDPGYGADLPARVPGDGPH